MTKDELLEALLVERQDQTWWKRPIQVDDSEIATARRRKALADEYERPREVG